MLVATMTWDSEDPDVHAHFTTYAHRLEDVEPRRWADTVRSFETALREYADKLAAHRARLETRLDAEDAARASVTGRTMGP